MFILFSGFEILHHLGISLDEGRSNRSAEGDGLLIVVAEQVGTVEAASRRQRRKHERAVAAALQVSGQALHFTIGMAFAVRKKDCVSITVMGASFISRL